MAWEIKEIETEALGTYKTQKYEVYDLYGDTSFSLSTVTYVLYDSSGNTVLSGSGTINNSDTDGAGNTIKTVTIPLDLDNTNVSAGRYLLVWTIALTDGQTDKGRASFKIRDFTERF